MGKCGAEEWLKSQERPDDLLTFSLYTGIPQVQSCGFPVGIHYCPWQNSEQPFNVERTFCNGCAFGQFGWLENIIIAFTVDMAVLDRVYQRSQMTLIYPS